MITGSSDVANPKPRRLRRGQTVAAVALTIVAAIPRFYDLGHLSLYSDEDLTALSAQSVVRGDGPAMPSGMAYLRALPFTYMNAASAIALGDESEAAYRTPAALFGTLTPAALYLTGSAFVSPPAALVAGAMLALSEWHVAFSRFARMYSPFLLFFVLSGFFFWRWSREGGWGNAALALLAFGLCASLHILGLFAIQFALIPVFLRGRRGPPVPLLCLVAFGAAAAAYAFDHLVVSPAYTDFGTLPDDFQLGDPTARTGAGAAEDTGASTILILLVAAGALVGGWLGLPSARVGEEEPGLDRGFSALAQTGSGMIAGAFLGAGHLWGTALAGAVALLLRREPFTEFLRRRWKPIAVFVVLGAAWVLYAVATLGLREGVSRVATYPFPYMAFFFSQFPGLVLLFAAATVWKIFSADRAASPGELGVILAVLMPMAAMGMVSAWGGTRYLFQLYPYMILAGAAVLVGLVEWAARRWSRQRPFLVPVLAIAIILTGVTGGHGIQPTVRAATLEHGEPINEYIHIFPFRPDHRGPGLYVRGSLGPGDVVISEDPAIQTIYAGQVDYWLRREGDARGFLYLDHEGTPREIYANAVPLVTPEAVEDAVARATSRAWLITSGETALLREYYLSEAQRRWLASVEERVEPSFVGEDGHSLVFCLNC